MPAVREHCRRAAPQRHRSHPSSDLSIIAACRGALFLAPASLGCVGSGFGVGMDRSEKADLVEELKRVFSETSVVVVTRNLGLSVAQSTDLRLKMRDAGAQF